MDTGAIGAGSNLSLLTNAIQQNSQRIASGQAINSAADDAAGLALSNRLDAQRIGFETSARSALDAQSYTEVADAALSGVSDILQRIRELSLQAGNGVLNDSDRRAIQSEVGQLQEQIQDQLENTSFNGQAVFGADSSRRFTVSPEGGAIELGALDFSARLEELNGLDVASIDSANSLLQVVDGFAEQVGSARGELGAVQNRLDSSFNSLMDASLRSAESGSRIRDADLAREISDRSALQVQQQVGIAMLAQANADRGSILRLLG